MRGKITHQGVKRRRLDFDTRKDSAKYRSGRGFNPISNPSATEHGASETSSKDGMFTVPPGSRKAVLVHLAREAWRAGLLDPKALGEVRCRGRGTEAREGGALHRHDAGDLRHRSRRYGCAIREPRPRRPEHVHPVGPCLRLAVWLTSLHLQVAAPQRQMKGVRRKEWHAEATVE